MRYRSQNSSPQTIIILDRLGWVKSLTWMLLIGFIRLRFPQVKPLSTDQLAIWLDREALPEPRLPEPLLLDVRTLEEYQISHLKNAQLAPTSIEAMRSIAPPETPIVTYCSVGYRSAKVAQALQQAGYQQVFNLEGSIFRWMNEGRSVYRNGKIVQQVHPYNWFWNWFLQLPPLQQ